MADRTLRLLFLDQFGEIGGGQRILLDLAEAAKARGWRVAVLCPFGSLADALRRAGAEVHVLAVPPMRDGPKSVWTLLRAFIPSRRAAQEHRSLAQECDLIVVNGPRMLAIARAWVQEFHKPSLLYLHGVYGRLENVLIRSFLSLSRTAAIAPSSLVASPFARLKNVHMISNWVSAEFLEAPPDAGRLRQVLGSTDAHPIVLVPGRFSPHKGQLLVLEASRLLADVPCHFVFAGAPLFEEKGREVEARLREEERRKPERMHVLRWKETMPSLYDGADIVVIPSVWEEPFGLTAIEAMARGRPLMVTDRGTLPALADGGRMARVVPAHAAAFAAALREFLGHGHRGLWEDRAQQARKHVEAHFHPRRLQQEVCTLCETLLES